MNQSFTCLIERPAERASRLFSFGVGYGESRCSSNHALSTRFDAAAARSLHGSLVASVLGCRLGWIARAGRQSVALSRFARDLPALAATMAAPVQALAWSALRLAGCCAALAFVAAWLPLALAAGAPGEDRTGVGW